MERADEDEQSPLSLARGKGRFPVPEGRNGKSTWIGVASVTVALVIFLSGWFTGQRVAWTEAGQQLEKIHNLEDWKNRMEVRQADQDATINNIGQQAYGANAEATRLRDEVKELRTLVIQGCRGQGR